MRITRITITYSRMLTGIIGLFMLTGSMPACAQLSRGALRDGKESNQIRGAEARGEVKVGGLTRTYLFYVPRSYRSSEPIPIVFALHGGGGQGRGMARLTSMNDSAERENFIVVYPDGIEKHWNDGRPTVKSKTDDVGFINALIDKFESDYNVDRKRVYATGISNGGMMVQRLACELSDKIATVASDASAMPAEIQSGCRPPQPVSVLVMDGTTDPIVPYNGGPVKSFGGSGYGGAVLSAEETVKFWAGRDECSTKVFSQELPDQDPNDGTRVRVDQYPDCKGGSGVALYSIAGGGHTWPGGWQYLPQVIIGRTSRDIDANRVIWKFFKQHPKTR